MAYIKTDWKARTGQKLNKFLKLEESSASVVLVNSPDLITNPGTPFDVSNMMHIEQGIEDAHELVEKARQYTGEVNATIDAVLNNLIGLPQFDDKNYIITFTARNGSTLEIDLPLEGLAQNLDYDSATKELILTRQDKTQLRISISDLIDIYEGSTGSHIQISVGQGNVINAALLAGTITETELAATLLGKINSKAEAVDLTAHAGSKNNPHEVTKAQVGLSNVTNDAQVKRSEMGTADGVATLDSTGLIPVSQIPEGARGIIKAATSELTNSTTMQAHNWPVGAIVLCVHTTKGHLNRSIGVRVYLSHDRGCPTQIRWNTTNTGNESVVFAGVWRMAGYVTNPNIEYMICLAQRVE